MASPQCPWIAFIFLYVMTNANGVFGRAVEMQGFLLQPPTVEEEPNRPNLRTYMMRRWTREVVETQRGRCADLATPWMETTEPPEDFAKMLHLRVRSHHPGDSRRMIFPEQSLLRFIRRVYHCCQVRLHCRSVKGIQGYLRGDKDVEFFLTRDVWSLAVTRAEIHLQLYNPQRLDIKPMLPYMAKHNLPTRYSLWSKDDTVELRVDLLFPFQGLQKAAGVAGGGSSLMDMRRVGVLSRGDPRERLLPQQSLQDTDGDQWGEGLGHLLPARQLGLALNCSKGGLGVSCEHNGLHLLHTPFIALSYT